MAETTFDTPRFFEIARWSSLGVAIFVSYLVGGGDPVKTLHYLAFLAALILAGLTGVEGMFFGAASARSMGREPSPEYQKQSAGAMLAIAVTAIIVFGANWGVFADATVLIVLLLVFMISAAVHAWGMVSLKNYNKKNMLRPALTLLIVGVCAWPLIAGVLKK